ncbi:MAG: gfo/Idh/MocA family oxidoreductase [Acidobacteria bacterium]|nr:MAG: gfo/Idh/MocA family oxidoreductase [Acidobacteriota bacterium]
MKKVKIAVFGCGFWSQFQIGGWLEFPEVEIVALYNRTLSRAQARGGQFGIGNCYDDPEAVFRNHDFDVVDIITDVDTHCHFVELAVRHGKDVICQKPMAPDFETAQQMLLLCREAGVRYYVHENYRWQPQIRRVKRLLESGVIGEPFRARTAFNTAYPVFVNQPFLAELEQFAITDQGSHQFDVCRFLFGEVSSLYTRTQTVNRGVKGEDVVTTVLQMKSGVVCNSEISFASLLEREAFPQTLMLIEGSKGSMRLDIGPEIRVTTKNGTTCETVTPERYSWQHPDYKVEPPSIVSCNGSILDDLLGRGKAETTGEDNFETVKLVFSAYESARQNAVVHVKG